MGHEVQEPLRRQRISPALEHGVTFWKLRK
jgi:hypothetical protein